MVLSPSFARNLAFKFSQNLSPKSCQKPFKFQMVLPMISGQWPIILVLVPLVHNSINRGDGHDQLITIYLLSFIPDQTHLLQALGRATHTIYTSRWVLHLKKVSLHYVFMRIHVIHQDLVDPEHLTVVPEPCQIFLDPYSCVIHASLDQLVPKVHVSVHARENIHAIQVAYASIRLLSSTIML